LVLAITEELEKTVYYGHQGTKCHTYNDKVNENRMEFLKWIH